MKALRQFVEEGGTLVFLNRASDFAIEQFKLPLRNVVAGLPRLSFMCPARFCASKLILSTRWRKACRKSRSHGLRNRQRLKF